ncbi:lactonase family protein [Sinomonas sp. ASV486]|uniref:lactonase family protein n=1 Tax=Sinomonas sp. ASV486 TaxID=3051170 RepID=UPI0027DC8A43|nr:lactonase family protein [Sinomonas sp. ASV486]MDQ4490824.1 lactonase family protein [Sinomonas sp. ASV486]
MNAHPAPDGTAHTVPRLIAYVGSYATQTPGSGGIFALGVSSDGTALAHLGRSPEPQQAGYLAYAPTTGTLYAVDERKNDGRGPVEPPAAVHAYSVGPHDAKLSWLNTLPAPGPRPTFLSVDEEKKLLVTANHGDFDHVERVVRTDDGGWTVEYVYDDSTVLLYALQPDGALAKLLDVKVMDGHGQDPNSSPQAGGHGQSGAHAHSAVIDPSGQYVLVGDKGTDQIRVYALGTALEPVSEYQFPPETGPRHIAFDPQTGNALVTCEFASDLASLSFDRNSGKLRLLDQVPAVGQAHEGLNEPAEVRVHPNGRFAYVNNRGEDSLAWFSITEGGRLERRGHVPLAPSVHPGLAARSFAFAPGGAFILLADRPANTVRSYAVDPETGALAELAETAVPEAAYIEFVELP